MSDLISFDRAGRHDVPAHRVYLKSMWGADWGDPVPWLHAETVSWNAQPTVNAATLSYRYGHGRRPGAGGFAKIWPLADLNRMFVKIEIDTVPVGAADETLVWYGVIDAMADDVGGVIQEALAQTGGQLVSALGLEDQLRHQQIASARTLVGDTEYLVGRGIAFNADGRPNRSTARGVAGTYLFAGDAATASYWSSLDIVEYLLAHHAPTDASGVPVGTWALSAPGGVSPIPTWDRPVIEADRHNVLSLLNRLMARQRLLSWHVSANDAGFVTVNPFTFAVDPVVVGALGVTIAANPTQARLTINSPDIRASVKSTTVDAVDQVVAYGARRRSCFTVSFRDDTLDIGWPEALETLYEEGASNAEDFPETAEVEERRRRHAEARAADLVDSVYSRFVVKATTFFRAGEGLGESDLLPVAFIDGDPTSDYPFYLPEFRLLPTIPLLAGRDYESSLSAPSILDPSRIEELGPLCLFPANEAETRWQHVELIGMSAAAELGDDDQRDWSASVRVRPDDGSIWIRVSGQPQHVIAETDFAPLGDEAALIKEDYRNALLTVAAEEDRYASAMEPGFAVPAAGRAHRVLRIWAGDQYRQDFVVPGTVLGINPASGALQRSDEGGFVRDDTGELQGIAQLAYRWYGTQRKSVTLQTYPNSALQIGQIIRNIDATVEADAASIGTPITSIKISIPGGLGTRPGPITLVAQTAFAELDALHFAPR